MTQHKVQRHHHAHRVGENIDLVVSEMCAELVEVVGEVRKVVTLGCCTRGAAAPSVVVEHELEFTFEGTELVSQSLKGAERTAMAHVDRRSCSTT